MQNLETIRDWLRYAVTQFEHAGLFYGHGTDNAIDEARFLVFGALKLSWQQPELWLDARLTNDEKQRLAHLIDQRVNERKPVAYLLGEAWYYDVPFFIDDSTLVPRSPIAELIDSQFLPWLTQPPEQVLDLCSGSGCLGILTAMAFPEAAVALAELNPKAVALSQRNIERHHLGDRVAAYESDLFAGLPAGQTYDLIIANPPYVDAQDMQDLPAEFKHEPAAALESGDTGLDLTNQILKQAPNYLSDGGILICEVGNSAGALQQAHPDVPFIWLEFERGGFGVFLLDVDSIRQHFC
ncbi:50S ribosomal protein L3 N(5)-glutamine methyltransferase [Salinibius halmophilus]|uniref:50S ribosomal protein L3 N(5)-glutamine methyltransferase n=1 Tax=Salinibius halmophilus TaxID=1853216 RepID=UPI0018F6D1E3|nr:50S ribosomal protein L3 N(5)-glutamine methyltransferase [Salinibius halmophilus]